MRTVSGCRDAPALDLDAFTECRLIWLPLTSLSPPPGHLPRRRGSRGRRPQRSVGRGGREAALPHPTGRTHAARGSRLLVRDGDGKRHLLQGGGRGGQRGAGQRKGRVQVTIEGVLAGHGTPIIDIVKYSLIRMSILTEKFIIDG